MLARQQFDAIESPEADYWRKKTQHTDLAVKRHTYELRQDRFASWWQCVKES